MKLSQYNIITKRGDNYLLINTKTGYIVELSGDAEKRKFEKIKNEDFNIDSLDNFYYELLEMGFIVEDLRNEFEFVKKGFDYYFLSDNFL